MHSKILICGSGPSLQDQLQKVDLSDFFVVRINTWEEIDGFDNKCDAWAFYPQMKGFEKYLSKAKSIWMPHFNMAGECEAVTGIKPNYTISENETRDFHLLLGNQSPTTGAVCIYMALLLKAKVYIAGFDFYQGSKTYYHSEGDNPKARADHHPLIEKRWVDSCIKSGLLSEMGGIK